jgi:outer membrane protein
MRILLAVSALAIPLAAPALAQDILPPDYASGDAELVLELGGGAKVQPAYEGADDYVVTPWPIARLHYLRLPVIGDFGGGPKTGLSFGPSFRYVPARDEDDYSELEGMGDVSAAYEFGATLGYRYEMLRGFVTLRQGFGGHHGLIGEVGLDVIVEPIQKLEVSLGPRVGFADSDYLDTYLGVSAEQSAASGLPEFDPEGGFKSLGLETEARYALTPAWSLVATAGYDRLIGDAADSPVTGFGSENQFNAGLGLTYRFGLDLYD